MRFACGRIRLSSRCITTSSFFVIPTRLGDSHCESLRAVDTSTQVRLEPGHPTCYLAPLSSGKQDIRIKTLRYPCVSLLCLSVIVLAGCAQQAGSIWSNGDAGATRPLPFDRTPDNTGASATADLPHPWIPAGTAIVIRLQSPISSANAHPGDTFQSLLDEPVLLANRTVLQGGTPVRGRILTAKAGEAQEAGYLRLTLSAIATDSQTLDIHTSSLFAKGSLPGYTKGSAQNRSRPTLEIVASGPSRGDDGRALGNVEFSTARRLTFRLLKPVPLGN